MATIPRAEAIRAMTAAVEAEPDAAKLYETSRNFFPAETHRGEPRTTTVERLVRYLHSDLSPDLAAEFWQFLHINRHRRVWYNEEDDHIYYTRADEYDPVGVE